MECLHLTKYLKIVQSNDHLLKENKIKCFSKSRNCIENLFKHDGKYSGEPSFSKLKRIKNESRKFKPFVSDVHCM